MAGWPGAILFCLVVIAMLYPMARGLRAHRGAEQMVMCVLAFVIIWPLQSTSSFTTQPTAGWVFIALGWALAATRKGWDSGHTGADIPDKGHMGQGT